MDLAKWIKRYLCDKEKFIKDNGLIETKEIVLWNPILGKEQ